MFLPQLYNEVENSKKEIGSLKSTLHQLQHDRTAKETSVSSSLQQELTKRTEQVTSHAFTHTLVFDLSF